MTTQASPPDDDLNPDSRIKVWFRFVQGEDGWPPVEEEGVWAVRLDDDLAEIHNIPFFVQGSADRDVVRVRTAADGRHWAVERVRWSGNCTIRVLPFRDGPIGPSARGVWEKFAGLGVTAEGHNSDLPLVALSVPPEADLAAVKRLLAQGDQEGWWWHEESCIGDAWRSA
ncbi:DUF4265 domain-containing protein [Micromonospora sp. NPDC050417]|uniref:DUF4265 domain-containing protein n=1 Tax=Micromonospora sp. NPDC050417 TaxID=3364280 RepID=UPI003790795E